MFLLVLSIILMMVICVVTFAFFSEARQHSAARRALDEAQRFSSSADDIIKLCNEKFIVEANLQQEKNDSLQLKNECDRLHQQLNMVKGKLNTAEDHAEQLGHDITREQTTAISLTAQLNKLKDEAAAVLRNKVEAHNVEKIKAMEENATMQDSVESLNLEVETWKNNLDQEKRERALMNQQQTQEHSDMVAQLLAENQLLKEKISSIEKEKAAVKKDCVEVDDSQKECSGKFDKAAVSHIISLLKSSLNEMDKSDAAGAQKQKSSS